MTADLLSQGLLWRAESTHDLSAHSRRLKGATASFGIEELDRILPQSGLSCGALHEWWGSRSLPPLSLLTHLGASLLTHQSHSDRFIFWIGREVWPTPYLLAYRDPHLLSRSLFLDPPTIRARMWSIETVLRSSATALVVAPIQKYSFGDSRRLSLIASRSGATAFLLFEGIPRAPSAAMTRWHITPHPSECEHPCLSLQLLQVKGARPFQTRWTIEVRDETLSLAPPPYRRSEVDTPDRNVGAKIYASRRG